MNNAAAGWKKVPFHLLGFGIPFGLLVWFGGWSGAAVLVAWRAWAEYEDLKAGFDTPAKAAIDFGSQIILTVGVGVIKYAF